MERRTNLGGRRHDLFSSLSLCNLSLRKESGAENGTGIDVVSSKFRLSHPRRPQCNDVEGYMNGKVYERVRRYAFPASALSFRCERSLAGMIWDGVEEANRTEKR